LSNSQLRSTDKGDARFVIGCAHREVNNRNPAIDTSKRREPSEQLLHLFEQGQIFENEVVVKLSGGLEGDHHNCKLPGDRT